MLVTDRIAEQLNDVFEGRSTAIVRDLKLNLKRLTTEGALTPEEVAPALVATAASVMNPQLVELGRAWMSDLGYDETQVLEAQEAAALMAMLNTYYSFIGKLDAKDKYGGAGLRMTALAKTALSKERFEMLAFAVSVINGCASCINAHEKVLVDHGVSHDKIHDLARLGAVVKAVSTL